MLERGQVFDRLRRKRLARTPATADGIARRGAGRAPLSFAQERLWFLDQLDRGAARFNVLSAIRFWGFLDLGALGSSLSEMVRRHEILRTTFPPAGRNPEQVVGGASHPGMPRIDLSGLDPDHRERHLGRLYTLAVQRPFDLARGPLTRWPILILGPDEHVLVLVMHQIISDRWSRGVFVREVATLYRDAVAGRPSSLPEPSLQYTDFALWQRRSLTAERLEPHLEHWRRRLRDAPLAELPADRLRPPVASHRGRMIYKVIEPGLLARLELFSRQRGLTLFMTLLAALVALLARYSGRTDLTLGAPVAQRKHRQVSELIGFFINMLPLRCRTAPGASFDALAEEARRVSLDAFTHGEVPFERIVDALVDGRDLSRHPLFQVAIVLQNTPLPSVSLPGLDIRLAEVDWGTTAFDLSFFFWETALWEHLDPGLSLTVTYSTDLYDATTVHRLCGHLQGLLESALDSPHAPLEALGLLTPGERHQALREWSVESPAGLGRSGVSEPATTLDRLLDRLAAERGTEVVLVEGDRSLRWSELERRTATLARGLRRAGVDAESAVATCLTGADQVLAILAIVRAGGCYVPLDPALPAARAAEVLACAGAGWVVVAPGADPPAGVRSLDFRHLEEPVVENRSAGSLPVRIDPEHLAYVLTTSGSTGRPKSVGVSHRAVLHLVSRGPRLKPGARMAQLASPSFDAYTFEVWASLLHGSSLVVIDPRSVLDAGAFRERVRADELDAAFLTTALFHQLVAQEPGVFTSLSCLLFGGEPPRPGAVAAVRRACPELELWHAYGPTEATTFATLHRVEAGVRGAQWAARPVPIGRPLPGTPALLLDGGMRPVPAGGIGEIWLGGPGLARGYLGDATSTAVAFRPDPFKTAPGARLYRTGDRGRHGPDGVLVFQGRIDGQLKVRGHRIEPREIEAVLEESPEVERAVVTVTPAAALAAHVVLRDGETPGDPQGRFHDLTGLLRRRLPAYMVPLAIAFHDQLPRTASGKVDRAALAASGSTPWVLTAYVAPRNDRERELAALFRRVLASDREVGIYDDFFTLGGHSLSAAELVAELHRRYGALVDMMTFFERPTVAGLLAAAGGGGEA